MLSTTEDTSARRNPSKDTAGKQADHQLNQEDGRRAPVMDSQIHSQSQTTGRPLPAMKPSSCGRAETSRPFNPVIKYWMSAVTHSSVCFVRKIRANLNDDLFTREASAIWTHSNASKTLRLQINPLHLN